MGFGRGAYKPQVVLSLDFHTSLHTPQFFYYYYFNTTLALFLKSAALEQFFSDVSWLPATLLENRNNQIF